MNAKQISYLSTNYVLSAFIGYPSSMQKVIKFHSLQMIGRNYLFSLFEFLCVCQNKKEMQKITRTEFVYVCIKMFFMGYFLKSVRLDTIIKHLKARSVQLKAPHLFSLPIPLRLPPPLHFNPLLCRQPPLFVQPTQVLAVNVF